MDKELKPCPLCGSVAELKETYYLESEHPYSYVHCSNHQCDLHHHKTAHFSSANQAKNSEEAIAAWNLQADIAAKGVDFRGRSATSTYSTP